jgi:hypothetical protein
MRLIMPPPFFIMPCTQNHTHPVCATCHRPQPRAMAMTFKQPAVTQPPYGYPIGVWFAHTDMCRTKLAIAGPTRAPQMNPLVRQSPESGRRYPDPPEGGRPDPYPPRGLRSNG